MAKFRIATPTGTSYATAGDYGYEMEALTPIDAEIFEIRPGSEDEFVSAARGHVRQGGVVSRLVEDRHQSGGASRSRLRSLRLCAAVDGMADCAAATAPLSSPAPSAHRCAAAGLDSSTAAERLASMPSTAQWIA